MKQNQKFFSAYCVLHAMQTLALHLQKFQCLLLAQFIALMYYLELCGPPPDQSQCLRGCTDMSHSALYLSVQVTDNSWLELHYSLPLFELYPPPLLLYPATANNKSSLKLMSFINTFPLCFQNIAAGTSGLQTTQVRLRTDRISMQRVLLSSGLSPSISV